MKRIIFSMVLAFLVVQAVQARPIKSAGTQTFVIDQGDGARGIYVSVTTTTVFGSSAAVDAGTLYRLRSFQNTNGTYDILATTFTPVSSANWATAPGWIITKSTGSWSTRGQYKIYFTLDPSAGSATSAVKGNVEFQNGEVPAR